MWFLYFSVVFLTYCKYNSPCVFGFQNYQFGFCLCVHADSEIHDADDGSMDLTTRRIMFGATGGVISVFIIAIAVFI